MPEKLSQKQSEILQVLRERPNSTIEEIGKKVGLSSKSTVWEHLRTMQRKGLIFRPNNSPRSIELVINEPLPRPSILLELQEENRELKSTIEAMTIIMSGGHRIMSDTHNRFARPKCVIFDASRNELRCKKCGAIQVVNSTWSVVELLGHHNGFNRAHNLCELGVRK
ncbi:MAG: winged helix-turn-helix transcriptional regulator [Hyphomicrobiaceae bacterium]|nr:MAG: winged helix-turn-helix transcriptional regulator [Hyphomicrobiaceae bacterium]